MQMILYFFIKNEKKLFFDAKRLQNETIFLYSNPLFIYSFAKIMHTLPLSAIWQQHPELILGFIGTIIIMLILDLFVFHKKAHTVSNKEALGFSIFWISLAMLFSGIIYFEYGFEAFSQFQAAYWIEKALSVDNLFVFVLVFSFFKIPSRYQHEVLFYGVLGAILFRAIFIFAGVEIINHTYFQTDLRGFLTHSLEVNPIMLAFGIFLLIAGIKSGFPQREEVKKISDGVGYKLINKLFKVSPELHGDHFFTVQNGVKMITPLLVALIIIEITDLVFALDSIPAIFAIAPESPFILYSSNIFAILGLRSLYFLLANSLNIFSKLNYGLAVILSFIGIKMIISPRIHLPIGLSLGVIVGVLALTIIWSVMSNKLEHDTKPQD